MKDKKEILFVCTGNTCRSAMAEGIFKKLLIADDLSEKYDCSSAGIAAYPGSPANENAITVLSEHFDIDITNHRTTRVSVYLIQESLLILTMTLRHKKLLVEILPELENRIFTLNEYVGNVEKTDVEDPYGGNISTYLRCAEEIYGLLDKLVKII